MCKCIPCVDIGSSTTTSCYVLPRLSVCFSRQDLTHMILTAVSQSTHAPAMCSCLQAVKKLDTHGVLDIRIHLTTKKAAATASRSSSGRAQQVRLCSACWAACNMWKDDCTCLFHMHQLQGESLCIIAGGS